MMKKLTRAVLLAAAAFLLAGMTACEHDNGSKDPTLSKIEIKVDESTVKTTYTAGEEFNRAGITVVATYSDGSTKDVTDKATFTATYNGEAFTTETAGTYEVTLTATYEGKSDSATCTITVKPASDDGGEKDEGTGGGTTGGGTTGGDNTGGTTGGDTGNEDGSGNTGGDTGNTGGDTGNEGENQGDEGEETPEIISNIKFDATDETTEFGAYLKTKYDKDNEVTLDDGTFDGVTLSGTISHPKTSAYVVQLKANDATATFKVNAGAIITIAAGSSGSGKTTRYVLSGAVTGDVKVSESAFTGDNVKIFTATSTGMVTISVPKYLSDDNSEDSNKNNNLRIQTITTTSL